jgi:hypothetical protein
MQHLNCDFGLRIRVFENAEKRNAAESDRYTTWMLRRCVGVVLLVLCGCTSAVREAPAVLKGHLVLDVAPNPLVARPLGGDLYELAFDIIMRESGGVDVRIEDFTIEAIAFRTVPVRSETYPASFITDRGYPAEIAAGKVLRFSFVKRWSLPTRLLLSGAAIRVTARTIDRDGRRDAAQYRYDVVVAPAGTAP